MANLYGIPIDVEERLRARDTSCVYCRRQFSTEERRGWPTIEHLSEKPPFHWGQGLKEDGLAICCWSCNSSRGQKTLRDWFRTRFCQERSIGPDTVAAPVQRFLRSLIEQEPDVVAE